MTSHSPSPPSDAVEVRGRLSLFGHQPTSASVHVLPRSRRWRTIRALRTLGVGLLLAPLVGLVPPHAPWAIGALAGGVILARRRFAERFTLVRMEGRCPRCGEPRAYTGATRLRTPHGVPCEACHHESALHVEDLPGTRDASWNDLFSGLSKHG